MPAVLPALDPLGGGGAACPGVDSGLGMTLALLVMVVPFCVTVMMEGTRLGAWVEEGSESLADVIKVVGVDVLSVVVDTTLIVNKDVCTRSVRCSHGAYI